MSRFHDAFSCKLVGRAPPPKKKLVYLCGPQHAIKGDINHNVNSVLYFTIRGDINNNVNSVLKFAIRGDINYNANSVLYFAIRGDINYNVNSVERSVSDSILARYLKCFQVLIKAQFSNIYTHLKKRATKSRDES